MAAPILVTGGAGFLGAWLVRQLVERGDAVRVLDLPSARWDQLPRDHIDEFTADIRDRAAVARAVLGCRAVVHAAGLPQLWARPRGLFRQINALGAANVLEEAAHAGSERIIYVSSATIWPRADAPTCRWSEAIGLYCQSKLLGEQTALRLARGGAPIVIVSPAALIGPGDWSRTPATRLLLDFCLGRRRESIDARLDLVDVRDVARGIIAALQQGVPGDRFLLGNTVLTVVELYERLAALTGQAVPSRRVPYSLALLASVAMEWWADVTGRPPAACAAAIRLTRRPPPENGRADLQRLGVMPRPLDQTLADVRSWFREVGWLDSNGAATQSANNAST